MIDQLQKQLNDQKDQILATKDDSRVQLGPLKPALKSCLRKKGSDSSSVPKSLEITEAVLEDSSEVDAYNEIENKLRIEK